MPLSFRPLRPRKGFRHRYTAGSPPPAPGSAGASPALMDGCHSTCATNGGFWGGMVIGLVLLLMVALLARTRVKSAERESACA